MRAPVEPVPGAQWWTAGPVGQPERPLVAGAAVLPVAIGAAAAVIGLMLLPVLVAAVALGSADHDAGRTGAIGPGTYAVLSTAACALCVGTGSWLTGHLLRRAAVDRRSARRVAGLTGSVVAVLLVGHGLAVGRPETSAVAGLLAAAVAAAWLGGRLGSGAGAARGTSGRG